MNLLHPGEAFPSLAVSLPGGETLELPNAVAGGYAVVLLFRGSWCPYCNAQLRAFQRAQDAFAELGVRVVALSVDDEPTTRALIEKHGLTFPVGYGADARALREALGAFVTGEPPYLESTGVVLDPDGRVLVSVYSSNAIGRLVPDDVAGFIRYVRDKAPAEAA
jgi:peroxiredoxin